MLIDQRKLKLLGLASCHDECIMIYFKTFCFSKLARILQSNWPQNQSPLVSWYDIPTCKIWCWLIKGNPSYHKKLMFHLKPLFLASWEGFYNPITPKNNPHLCLDMIYPSAKFDVDWLKETQVIVKNLMFDARLPAHPTAGILILITWFHLVKTWLKNIKQPKYITKLTLQVNIDDRTCMFCLLYNGMQCIHVLHIYMPKVCTKDVARGSYC